MKNKVADKKKKDPKPVPVSDDTIEIKETDGYEDTGSVTMTASEFEELKAHIEALQKEKAELRETCESETAARLRSQADFSNYRRRNAAAVAESMEDGKASVIKCMLPVLDDFERALGSSDGVEKGFLDGITLVYKRLLDELHKIGLEEISCKVEFDPEFHEAIAQEAREGFEKGRIIEVYRKGYKVNNKIIRHSMVKVAE